MISTCYELESPLKLIRKEIELEENSLPADKLYAETEYSAISPGTESSAWLGKPPLRPSTTYPRLIGYCNFARVEKVGQSLQSIRPGDYILTHQSHRSAFICDPSDVLLRVNAEEINSEVTKKRLTATYLYHLGYSALLAGGYQPGHQVAIIGMGTLGLTTATLVKTFGSQPFLFTDQKSSQRNLMEKGFSYIFGKEPPEKSFTDRLFGMGGVDISINTSNKWTDHLLAMQLARKGGTVICLGFPGRGEPPAEFNPLDSQFLFDKQLTIRHCGLAGELDALPMDVRFTVKRNMQYLATLILYGLIDPCDILSREVSWNSLDTLYQSLARREPGLYSALLKWDC